jgi:hypothetical protein
MRIRAAIAAIGAVAVGLAPSAARANGGAYVEFEGTHHLPGEQVQGELYVSVPAAKVGLLDRGPFYAYLLPGGRSIDGSGLPAGAIRVGTFDVERDGKQAELRVSLTVPEVPGDYYQVGLCNDPCTITGFGVPVSGSLSIVATEREAALLSDLGRANVRANGLQRDLHKAEKAAEAEAAVADLELEQSEAARSALSTQIRAVEADLAAATEDASGRVDGWAAAAVAIALAVAGWLAGRGARRRRQVAVSGRQPSPSRSLVGNAAENAGASGSPASSAPAASSSRVAEASAAATSSTE